MQEAPSQVLQDQLEQLQHQHDQYRAEALQSMQTKDELVQQLQQQNEQLIQQSASQVRSTQSPSLSSCQDHERRHLYTAAVSKFGGAVFCCV